MGLVEVVLGVGSGSQGELLAYQNTKYTFYLSFSVVRLQPQQPISGSIPLQVEADPPVFNPKGLDYSLSAGIVFYDLTLPLKVAGGIGTPVAMVWMVRRLDTDEVIYQSQPQTVFLYPPPEPLIQTVNITHYVNGTQKTTTLTASGGNIQADSNTQISIEVTYRNPVDARMYLLPWLTVKTDTSTIVDKPCEGSQETYPYTPTSVEGKATDTKKLPAFNMPTTTATVEIKIHNWELLTNWGRPAAGAITPLSKAIISIS